jgi:hypothetical protein
MIQDIKGRDLNIGNDIAYGSGGRRGGLRVGTIYEFVQVPDKEWNPITHQYDPVIVTRIRVRLLDGRRTMLKHTEPVVRLG